MSNRVIDINFIYFENSLEKCKKNILKRQRKERVEKELEFLERVSKDYKIPEGAKVVSVFETSK